MSDRLLSELFPRFVKKSQLEHLAKGPFGEGLLEKQGKRVYLKPGEQAPEGVQVQTGARGGQYYDEPGGGGAAQLEEERRATYDMGSVTREVGVPMTPEQEQQIQEQQQAATAHVSDRPATYDIGSTTVEQGKPLTNLPPEQEAELIRAKERAGGDYSKPDSPGKNTGDPVYDNFPWARDRETGYLKDTDTPIWDGSGNVLLPRSDPFPVQDIIDEGASKEQLDSLAQQFKDEQGYTDEQFNQYWNSVDDLSELMEDRSLDDLSIQDAFRYDKSGYDKPFYPGPSEDQMGTLENFRDWLQSKAGGNQGETQKMMKMMQKYNVDNKRRDPIVLSNKGGRQR